MKKDNLFWIGYSDLMTSMFFIMLVLFVTATGYLQLQKKASEEQKKATEEQLKKIEELQTAVKQLPEKYFEYQPQYKRFKLNKQIQFARGDAKIDARYNDYLIEVGNSINQLINDLKSNESYNKFDIKYLVVIEGMASKDNYPLNFELSYARAFSLYKLWLYNLGDKVIFNPNYCEIQIAGSGTRGIREFSGSYEYKNQQFLIHIVPKIGKILEK
jgi:predicted Holliday junction resolvase-like endonuclease